MLTFGCQANWLGHVQTMTLDNARAVLLAEARMLHEDGFVSMELPLPHVEHLREELDENFWARMRDEFDRIGIRPDSVHGPNLPSLDTPVDQTLERLRWHARACVVMGVRSLVVHPTAHTHPHVCDVLPHLMARDVLLAQAMSETLASGPTNLAIENLPTYGLAYLRALMTKLPATNVGICFDTGHWHLRPEGELGRVLDELLPRVVHLHLSDNHGLCDEHLAPGAGTFDWPTLMAKTGPGMAGRPWLLELGSPILAQHADALAASRAGRREALALARQTLTDM